MATFTVNSGTNTLVGTTEDDQFVFTPSQNLESISGSIQGGLGIDSFILNASASAETAIFLDASLTSIERFVFGSAAGQQLALLSIGFTSLGSGAYLVGSAGRDVMVLTATAPGTFTAPYLRFENWGPADGVGALRDLVVLQAAAGGPSTLNARNAYGSQQALIGNSFDDILNGSNSEDFLIGLGGNDYLRGYDGNDFLAGGAGDDIIDGGNGIDTASYEDATTGVRVDLNNTRAQDTIGAGIDTINNVENLIGSRFDDLLVGNSLDNRLEGGDGNDTLRGGAGKDVLIGGAGNDTLNGGSDDDKLFGGDGDDVLQGGNGNDMIEGGAGIDTVSYVSATSGVTVNLVLTRAQDTKGAGIDTINGVENIFGSYYDDVLTGDSHNNTLIGGAGNDILSGAMGNDRLEGGDGNDTLSGGSGDDTLLGGKGSDILIGHSGRDFMNGGADADIFRFYQISDSTVDNPDYIFDFSRVEGDKIDLFWIDADTSTAGNQAFHLGGAAFTQSAGELIQYRQGGNIVIQGDVNGDGVADFAILLNGANTGLLTANNFIL